MAVRWIKNQRLLAERLQVTQSKLAKWLTRPGAPQKTSKGWFYPDVHKFVLKSCTNEAVLATLDSDVNELKKWDIYERARRTKLANDFKEGQWITTRNYERIMSSFVAAVTTLVADLHRVLAPDVVGLTVAEAERAIKAKTDEILEKLADPSLHGDSTDD